jgi:hypothetical protein
LALVVHETKGQRHGSNLCVATVLKLFDQLLV